MEGLVLCEVNANQVLFVLALHLQGRKHWSDLCQVIYDVAMTGF